MKVQSYFLVLGLMGLLASCKAPTSSTSSPNKAWVVSTLAGTTKTRGYKDATGTEAQFNEPFGVAVDSKGNVYVADMYNHRIRKIAAEGVVSTLAGSGAAGFSDGNGTAAQFNEPAGVALDSAGNIYVADRMNHRIRKITAEGVVSTLAGSTPGFEDDNGTAAKFNQPRGVAVDSNGIVYVADKENHRIRKITAEREVSTLAGSTRGSADGKGTSAQFHSPYGVAVDSNGNVYVVDSGSHRLRKITSEGVVSTLTAAQFSAPFGVAVDSGGNVYVADSGNQLIRKITTEGVVSTLAGSGTEGFKDGTGTAAKFHTPGSLAVDSNGNVYVADTGNQLIRKIEYKVPVQESVSDPE